MALAWNAGWAGPSWWQKDKAHSPERSCRTPRQSIAQPPAGEGEHGSGQPQGPPSTSFHPQHGEAQGESLPSTASRQTRSELRGSSGRGDVAGWGEMETGEWVGGYGVSLWETHHEAGASLRAGQLASARNLAHHQSLQLLQLLKESPA